MNVVFGLEQRSSIICNISKLSHSKHVYLTITLFLIALTATGVSNLF